MISGIETVAEYCSYITSHPKESLLIGAMTACFLMSEHNRHLAVSQRRDSGQRRKAQHPKVPETFVRSRKNPEGLTLGVIPGFRKRLFCVPENGRSLYHCCVFGGSGSGKSVLITSNLLSWSFENMLLREHGKPEKYHVLCVDCKGELCNGMPDCLKLDPADRDSYGFDFYYPINREKDPSDDLINRTMYSIAECFIPKSGKENEFFTANATGLLTGLLIYYFFKKIGFVDAVLKILTANISDILKQCYEETDEDDLCYGWLGKFKSEVASQKGPSEAFQNICSEMTTKLSCIRSSDVIWSLRDNPKKANVSTVVDDKSFFLCIDPSRLNESEWAPIFRCIISQEMKYLISDPNVPDDRANVCILIDEFYIIGGGAGGAGIPGIEDFASIARSYKSYLYIAAQSVFQLYSQYTKDNAEILLSNFRVRVYLEAADQETSQQIIRLCGKYYDREISVNGSGRSSSSSISWHERDVFDASELSNLASTGKVIVVTQIGENSFYLLNRLKYYEDPYFKKISAEIHNQDQKK